MPSEGERIAVLENEMKNVVGALKDLTLEVKSGFGEIKEDFVSRKDFDEFKDSTRLELERVKERKLATQVLSHLGMTLLGAALTYLLVDYLSRL